MEDKTVWSGRPRPLNGEAGPSQLSEAERDPAPHPVNRNYSLLSRLRSYFVYDPLIWLYTVVFGITSIPFGFFDKDGSILHGFARNWSKLIMKTIFSPVRIIGMEKIDTSRTYVYAVNHASALDIPVLYASLPFQFRIVHKRELLSYPVIGWHLKRSGQVCVDQQNPSHSVGQIKSAVRTLKNGMPLVIFPEGGRTADGHIQPFLAGAFFMAIKANVDIVPIALIGTYELLPMNTFHIKSRPLEMRVGNPIPTSGLSLRNLEALSAKVRQEVQALYDGSAQVSSLKTNDSINA
jgi:1-acyl-sn-glycerol-3-phosphate acyltransferase